MSKSPTVESIGSLKNVADADLWRYFEALRRIGDVAWDEGSKAWLVSSYDLVKQITLREGDDFKSARIYDPEYDVLGLTEQEWSDAYHHGSPKKLANLQGAEHDSTHRWWMHAFAPKVLAQWKDQLIEPLAHRQIDAFAGTGRAELSVDYCEPVVWSTTAAVLGLPMQDPEWFRRVHELNDGRPTQNSSTPQTREQLLELGKKMVELPALLHPIVLGKRADGANDFIGIVWRDAEELYGAGHEVRDLVGTVVNALAGATDSVGILLASAFYLVMSEPGLQERVLARGDDGVRRLVEEAVRLYGNGPALRRRATRDTEIGGVSIKKGEYVVALVQPANRDPRHYANPDRLDLDRRAPNDHLGFGLGPRTCAGQVLARFMAQRTLAVALERLPNLGLDPAAVQPRYEGDKIRNWHPLHARFDVTERGGGSGAG